MGTRTSRRARRLGLGLGLLTQKKTVSGFERPIDMSGGVDEVTAGSTVPVKFDVSSHGTELTDPDVATVTVTEIGCDTSEPLAEPRERTAAYVDDHFQVDWKTPRTPGSCFEVAATTADGASVAAQFSLR